MSKHFLASCVLVGALSVGSAWAANVPKCSDDEVEKTVASLIVGNGLSKTFLVRDFGYVATDVTYSSVVYKYYVDKNLLGGIVNFKFDAERERRSDAGVGKRYCTANLSGSLNPDGLKAAIKMGKMGRRQNEIEERPLTAEEMADATADAAKKVPNAIRWNNPQNYSVQALEKGGVIVTLDE